MTPLDEKLLDRIKDEVAQEKGFKDWQELSQNVPDDHEYKYWPEVCRRYAEEVYRPDFELVDKHIGELEQKISQLKKQLEDMEREKHIMDCQIRTFSQVFEEDQRTIVDLKTKLEVKEKPDSEVGKDWTEDFTHENGNYLNRCIECGEQFKGHKRRVICKKCFTPNWVELAKKTPPEDNKCAHAGCWADGEMTGFARCMVKEVFPRDEAIAERDKEIERLKQSRLPSIKA